MPNTIILLLLGWILSFILPTVCLAIQDKSSTYADITKSSQSRIFQTILPVPFAKPKYWEILNKGAFQNRGIAKIEKLGKEYVLTVYCEGTHRVFIHHPKNFNLEYFSGQFVQARYTYGDIKKEIQCIKKPSKPVTLRKILIQDLEKFKGSEEMRAQFEANCNS